MKKQVLSIIGLSLIMQIALLITSTPSIAACPSAEHIDVNAYVYDSIIYVGDVDYFSFTLPVSGAVAIYGKMDLGEVIEGTLYNSSCTSVLATGTLIYPYTYFYFPSLPAGSYVLKIEGLYTSTLGNYWIYVAYEGPTTSPEMDVKGNGYSISDGDMSPQGADNTLFDYIWGTTHPFTIINTGTAELNLNGMPRVSISGAHAGDFSVTQQPNSPVASGGSTTFEVRFQPTGEGMREATISIANDDSNENPYNFAVLGDSSFLIQFPEIEIQGNGQEIMDGDTMPDSVDDTDFGTADVGTGSVNHTFTITNSGGAELNLDGTPFVNISGAHASDFNVTVQPNTPVAIGGMATFQVTFTPSAEGLREATISIANDDSNENPYNFAITGIGVLLVEDTDGDGLSDTLENSGCTAPFDADSDDDGLSDGTEDTNHNGFFDIGETDPCNSDSDGDGIQDGTEKGMTIGIRDPDGAGPLLGTDTGIFVPDADPSSTTDPLDENTDGDSWVDGVEDINHNGRIDPGETSPTVVTTTCDADFDLDFDVDGADFAAFIVDYGRNDCVNDCNGDFDFNGVVDLNDMNIFASQYGEFFCPLEWRDTDNDGILDDGDFSGVVGDYLCPDSATTDCDDNCINVFNPDQYDFDGDGIGDACSDTLSND